MGFGFDGEAGHEDEDDHVGEHDDRRDPHRREQAIVSVVMAW